jgi:voltage-gated potassium channel
MLASYQAVLGRAYTVFRRPLAVFVAIQLVGTAGYWLIAGGKATVLDSLYMTFITVATIGFAEIIDLSHSPGGRIFTIFIGLTGIASVGYMMSKLTAFIIESDISDVLRRRKMQDQITALSGHYLICGVGRVGSNVVQELMTTGRKFVAIEESTNSLAAFRERFPQALYLQGDASDDDLLARGGILRAAGLFAVTDDDGRNLLITLTAKQMNMKIRVVARCHEVRTIDKLKRVGADVTVSPDFTGGLRIASSMLRPTVVNFLDEMLRTDARLRVEEVSVPNAFARRTLAEAAPLSRDYIVLAVRTGEEWEFNPASDYKLRAGSTLVVMAHPEGREALQARLAASPQT